MDDPGRGLTITGPLWPMPAMIGPGARRHPLGIVHIYVPDRKEISHPRRKCYVASAPGGLARRYDVLHQRRCPVAGLHHRIDVLEHAEQARLGIDDVDHDIGTLTSIPVRSPLVPAPVAETTV